MRKQEAEETLWSGSSMCAAAVSKFLDSLNLIEALAQIGNPRAKKVTANKRRLAQSVINRTMDMAESLACYASLKGDRILAAKVSLSPASIARSWDPVISATAQSIYDLAAKIIGAGESESQLCGVTAGRNQLLINAIVAFSAAIGSDCETHGPEPFSLDAEFRRAEETLNAGVAPLMQAFKAQSDFFFTTYRKAGELAESLPRMMPNS